jgi:hypothetical protein
MVLNREKILSSLKLKKEVVDAFGGKITITERPAMEFNDFMAFINKKEDDGSNNIFARAVIRCAVNDKGERLFTDDDYAAICSSGIKAAGEIYAAGAKALELNGVTVTEKEADQAVKK